ncbi:CxC2 domain-containing protein [Mycena indigotica]|uniref:CxC2 domain-containing protein n=1 Tax=Mycena indigotica TaxID=2126181 RepID=A0A8H6S3H3_9AGAR|nr:CxC2 domain-containing protein [Mycena indigotica]KAF7291356.1 CxC2 domain-containing protein [Mycena indigotica]
MSSSSQKSRKRRTTGAPVLVRHHIMPVEELIGAPPDAPLTTSLHRVTTDDRRFNTETIVIEPPSPVKRARLEHLHRQQATVNLMPTKDPERYEMGLEAEEDKNEMETNPNRHSQPADPAMDLWMRQFRDPFLHSLLWRDGRGKEGEICAACGDSTRAAIYRCSSCFGGAMWCQGCCVAAHRANPLHFIEKWTGVYFTRTTLGSIGLRVQLAHPPHEICERPIPGRSDFVVLAANGIHEVTIDFCGCMGHDAHHVQLLKAGWYPATMEFPRTAATFSCLDKFHYLSLHGKTTIYDFYSALKSWTDGTGIKPPDRYSVFMRISRQYRHLLLLKRKGRGHDRFGVLGTAPGELATRCPACPRPGVNLPDGWENAPPEDRCLYIMFGDQRRIRGLVEVGKKRSSTGVSLRRQRRKLNRTIKHLRSLQGTYMPAALRRLEALHLPQDTLAERVPLIPPSALTPVERNNGGCRDGLVAIERALRDAQCRSSLTSLQLQLHVKSRLLTYKKNNSRRASDEYALTILALDEDDNLISWRKLEKKDIRCMEDAEEVSRAERKRERAERNERSQDLALARAGLVALPRAPVPMETSDAEEDETEAQLPATRSDRQHAAREANALFKHGESRRQVSWIWSNVHNSTEGVEEALRIEWAKSYARTRRWKEEVRILAAEWERLPLSFGAEEQAWLTRGKKVDISGLGGEVAEGMIAYATKQADMFRNLASRGGDCPNKSEVGTRKAGRKSG